MICIRILRKTPPLCTTLFFTYFAFANQLPGLSITGTLAANVLGSSFFPSCPSRWELKQA